MYNFTIPSTLKAWLDHVLRAGITFKYTPTGPQGLLTGKRAIVLTARGGIHAGASSDHQEPYLRQVMAFIGIHDVDFIHAEGLNMSGEFHERASTRPRPNWRRWPERYRIPNPDTCFAPFVPARPWWPGFLCLVFVDGAGCSRACPRTGRHSPTFLMVDHKACNPQGRRLDSRETTMGYLIIVALIQAFSFSLIGSTWPGTSTASPCSRGCCWPAWCSCR